MPFPFDPKVNPKKPLDLTDPPPECWDDAYASLLDWPTDDSASCRDWEKRELTRVERRDTRRDKRKKKVA